MTSLDSQRNWSELRTIQLFIGILCFMDELEDNFHIFDEQDKELILTGDLDCDFSPPDLLSHSRRLLDILELFQLR